ncbi:MAG TPA: hydroxypyruvate isomerase [Pseudomonas xinjiangensis]|uniref:Hydroxypyruvate isomerase n=2 Tax=root TaxID=1 RepID=A0A7V1BMF8_9GAMM|nr:hydroxypyruvate isomerase [Halopseudomonas xinjiangensis]HEC46815.1 hydroxypyruvate isomerase [Halopseudomonas xinjiangensis]
MTWPVAANLSLLFAELPLIDRINCAAHAGFDGVEIQFPYDVSAQSLAVALANAQMPLVLINVPAGDLLAGGAGLAGVPGREGDFADALQQALEYAQKVRPLKINVLPGKLVQGVEPQAALDVLAANLFKAASAFAELGVQVTCEAINRRDMPGFLIASSRELKDLLARVDHPNLSAQLDFYHMAQAGETLEGSVNELAGRIGHVQFADWPGRREPGSGGLNFSEGLEALRAQGYGGWLSAEYRPSGETSQGLQWLDAWATAGWIRPRGHNE